MDGEGLIGTAIQMLYGVSYIKLINLAITGFNETGINCNHIGYVSQYITIQDNKIYDIGRYDTTSSYGICGIYLRKGNHHWTIDKNLIFNIGRTGPDSYYMNKDHAVYTGTTDSEANAAHHINMTYNIMYSISGAHITTGSNDDLIANNVLAWRNENSQGASCFMAMDAGVSNLTIANNIFFDLSAWNPFAIQGYTPFTGWSIKNNMVYGGSMWQSADAARLAVMDGNNYGDTDCENAEVDPLFVSAVRANLPTVDFQLQSTSPAINEGVDVGLTTDFLGNAITGNPDMGAYEYQEEITSTTTTTTVAPTTTTTTTQTPTTTTTTTAIPTTTSTTTTQSPTTTTTTTITSTTTTSTTPTPTTTTTSTSSTITTTTTIRIYYNVRMQAVATKNNCPRGYVGSKVTYIVPSGRYSSLISQVDANNKASADITRNKQVYANVNGTCRKRAFIWCFWD